MAKHCTNCGNELRSGDKFCAECGTAVKNNNPSQATGDVWEFCDIDVVDAGDTVFGGSTYKWIASAIGKHGIYEVANSERLNGWPRGRRVGLGQELAPPTGRELEGYQQELQRFISSLMSDGWQPTQERGTYWYSYKFRRQPRSKAASSHRSYSVDEWLKSGMMEQVITTSVQKGPAAALMLLDNYLAGAPNDSEGYIQALLQQLHIYVHDLHNRDETLRVATLLEEAFRRRLSRDPYDGTALGNRVVMWRIIGNKEQRKKAEREERLASQASHRK